VNKDAFEPGAATHLRCDELAEDTTKAKIPDNIPGLEMDLTPSRQE